MFIVHPRLRLLLPLSRITPPYSFLGDDGEATGFNVDLTKAIARVANLDVTVDYRPWNAICADLEQGDIDGIAGMYYSKERGRLVDFSQPYAVIHHAVFGRRDSPAVELEDDLSGKVLLVMQGDIMADYVMQKGWHDHVLIAKNPAEALQRLASGEEITP